MVSTETSLGNLEARRARMNRRVIPHGACVAVPVVHIVDSVIPPAPSFVQSRSSRAAVCPAPRLPARTYLRRCTVIDPVIIANLRKSDEDAIIPMDRLADPRTAMFQSRYGTLVEQFKRGVKARVVLRFWPTWPATGTHAAVFSLIGFTRAYARMEECKP